MWMSTMPGVCAAEHRRRRLPVETVLFMWDSKWMCTSKLQIRLACPVTVPIPRQGVGNEAVELDLVRYFNSFAGWLRGWAELQAATGCGAKPVDGCRSSRNRSDTS